MLSYTIQLYKKAYSGLSRNSWYLCLVMFINRSGTMVIPFMTIYCTQKLHFTVEQAGYIMGLFGVGSLLGAFIGGKTTDKYGFYYVQIFALLVGGVLFILLGFQKTFITIGIGSFVLSVCNESFRPANYAAIVHYSTDENKTRSNSLNRLAVNLGWAFGGLLGGTLAHINYKLLFWVDGSTNIAAALLLLRLIPISKLVKPVKNAISTIRDSSPYKDGVYLIFIGLVVLFATCFFQIFTMQPLFYKTQWHFSEQFIGLLMGLNGLLIVIFEMVIIHSLEGRKHPLVFICLGALLTGAGFMLQNYLPPAYYAALIVMVFITVGEILAMPFMNSFWIVRTTNTNRGQYAALYTMAWSTAQIIAPLLGGIIIAFAGFNFLWWITAVICLCASVGFIILYRYAFKQSRIVPVEETVF
ncbi:MAG: transporter [Mucilaginibacter sp.]|nr:transporter [Mucilaginibacter sp.]